MKKENRRKAKIRRESDRRGENEKTGIRKERFNRDLKERFRKTEGEKKIGKINTEYCVQINVDRGFTSIKGLSSVKRLAERDAQAKVEGYTFKNIYF